MRNALRATTTVVRTATAAAKPTQGSFRAFSAKVYGSDSTPLVTSPRLAALRERLKIDAAGVVDRPSHVFEISPRGRAFLEDVKPFNEKYSRGGDNGEGYVGVEEVIERVADRYYTKEERAALLQQAKEVQDRMRVKVSKAYVDYALSSATEKAKKPNPILKIVMPDSREIDDLSGEIDPSNQNHFSPLPGLLHKYEMVLALVSVNCSSHCRYCYRLDLFSGVSNKSKADLPVIAAYIKTFNSLIDDAIKESGKRDSKTGLWLHKETNEPLVHVREILFSGGDPMTLPNSTIARYLALMAEAGVNTIRIGTKELVFNPDRFDKRFWGMMDSFHETYPEIKVDIVGHYSHPYELVEPKVDNIGEYSYDIDSKYRIRKDIREPLNAIKERVEWVGHYNQFPIISGLNDSPEVLRLLMYQTSKLGILMHNIYACREIPGNKYFRGDNTIEAQCKLLDHAKSVLSGTKNHARLIMSTEYGKIEVIGVDDGKMLLKLNRLVHGSNPENSIIVVDLSKLPDGKKFYWLTDDVIETAVTKEGKKTLEDLGRDGSLIKQFKQLAAQKVYQEHSATDGNEKKFRRKNCVVIEVKTRKGSKLIQVDLKEKGDSEKQPTLATVLSKEGYVEAACKEQLSCSTCVGEVESDKPLPPPTEDELDLVDSAIPSRSTNPNSIKKLRAGCQITLEAGGRYKFTDPTTDGR